MSDNENIRYHLSKLIESLNGKSIKRSVYHLNKLAYHLVWFKNKLEDNLILYSPKKTLDDFWMFLKYQVYPSLMKHDFDRFIEVLKGIELAFEKEDITQLNAHLNKYEGAINCAGIVLPYEKPHILNRIIKSISSKIQINFQTNFVFRLFCVTVLLLVIGYFISTITSLKIDNTIISALLIVAVAIAKESN